MHAFKPHLRKFFQLARGCKAARALVSCKRSIICAVQALMLTM